MKMLNNVGPKIEPCGTPLDTSRHVEKESLRLIYSLITRGEIATH